MNNTTNHLIKRLVYKNSCLNEVHMTHQIRVAEALQECNDHITRLGWNLEQMRKWGWYTQTTIVVKNKKRTIQETLSPVKQFGKVVNKELSDLLECPWITSGKNIGIVRNADRHKLATAVLKLDIKDFYPNCKIRHVNQGLSLLKLDSYWFNLINNYAGFFFNGGTQIPTGHTTSPLLANIALIPVDVEILRTLKEGMTYTRYLDDLTISFTGEIPNNYLHTIASIVEDKGWEINWKKTKWLNPKHDEWSVTGIDIRDGKLKVPRKYMVTKMRPLLDQAARGKVGYGKLIPNPRHWFDHRQLGHLEFVRQVNKDQYKQLLQYFLKRLDYYNYVCLIGKSDISELKKYVDELE